MVTNIWRELVKVDTPPSFDALAFHNGWDDHSMDACANIANNASVSDEY